MKRVLAGVFAVGFLVAFVASDALARGPGRGRGGAPRRPTAGAHRLPTAGPSNPTTSGGRPLTGAVRPPSQLGAQRPHVHAGNRRPPGLTGGGMHPNRLPGADLQGASPPPRPQGTAASSFQSRFPNRTPIRQTPAAQQAFGHWTSTHPQPFTPAWYWQHPNAWRATHPYAGQAAVVTAAGLATWLATVPYATTSAGDTVIVEETIVIEDPTPVEMPMEEEVSVEESVDAAAEKQWLSLGAYELLAPGEARATRVIELAVARDGEVRGNHFDWIGNDVEPIHGHVDQQTTRLSWTVGQGSAVFQATFQDLMQAQGQVAVQLPDGQTADWQVVRLAQ